MDYLKLVQGDSFEGQIEIFGDDAPNVVQLQFICPSLGWTYDLRETNTPLTWLLVIPCEDTENARVGRFSYNITATLHSGRVITAVYDAKLEIAQKVNKWNEAN